MDVLSSNFFNSEFNWLSSELDKVFDRSVAYLFNVGISGWAKIAEVVIINIQSSVTTSRRDRTEPLKSLLFPQLKFM